jgi:hypothetical protein
MSGTALGYLLVVRRPFGISGAVGTVLSREARVDEKQAESIDDKALEEAMLAATRAAFPDETSGSFACDTAPAEPDSGLAQQLGWSRSLAFLVGLTLGGAVFSIVTHATMETVTTGFHAHFFGDGVTGYLALLVGGIFVGAGTSMAGGCTSGHGLVGCARLQPGSLVATASFFGTAIAVSLLLSFLLGGAR